MEYMNVYKKPWLMSMETEQSTMVHRHGSESVKTGEYNMLNMKEIALKAENFYKSKKKQEETTLTSLERI